MSAVGKPLTRVDGRKKVTGAARFASEFRPEHLAQAVLVQSTIGKGRITRVDDGAARRVTGVIAVLTHENAPEIRDPKPKPGDRAAGRPGENLFPPLSPEIHFAGQNVAVVVAESLEAARHAASLVAIEYRADKPAVEIEDALASATYPEKFMNQEMQRKKGNVDSALAQPGLVKIDATYGTPVTTHNPMERGATVAEWKGDRLEVHDSTQGVMGVRNVLALAFGLPKENVRVFCPFTGGGFGCKGSQWPHVFLAALAAKAVGRPVRLVLSREQMFTSMGHRPPTEQALTLAARRDGTLVAIKHHTTTVTSPVTDYLEPCGNRSSAILYACENLSLPHRLTRVNVAAPTFMRAPGETPGTFALESAMDELAHALDMDPLALRLENYAESEPIEGKPWSSKHLRECYALGAERFGWKKRTKAPGSMKASGTLVGWGMATAIYPGNRWPASARVRLTPDGHARVQVATQDLGTGSYTIFTQIAADSLGLPAERVTFELGDSDFPEAPVSGGSNTTASVSEAILQAAAATKAKLAEIASRLPGAPFAGVKLEDLKLDGGRLVPPGGEGQALSVEEIVKKSGEPAVEAFAEVKPEDEKTRRHAIHSFGAHFCEVRIDPLLPRVQTTRWVTVMDVGRVVNPSTTRSQLLGGVTMGIGMALMEETVYDRRDGRPVTANLADYRIPVNADVPDIEVHLLEHPDPVLSTLGCRGVGEIGITGAGAAVANAVFHATGKRIRRLPITPDKLL